MTQTQNSESYKNNEIYFNQKEFSLVSFTPNFNSLNELTHLKIKT